MFPHRLFILVNFNRNLSQFRHKPRICSFFHCQLPCSSFFIVIQSLKSSSTITQGALPPCISLPIQTHKELLWLNKKIMVGQNYQDFKMGEGGALYNLGQTSPQPTKSSEKPTQPLNIYTPRSCSYYVYFLSLLFSKLW